ALLLECADVIGTLEAAEAARKAVQELPEAEQQRLLRHPRRRRIFDELLARFRTPATEALPGSWPEWFERLERPAGIDRAVVAARGAGEWDPATLSQRDVGRLAGYLQRSWPPEAQEVLWLSLPHLVAFLQRGAPERFRAVYLAMLDLLAIEGRCGPSDLSLISDLARALLDVG